MKIQERNYSTSVLRPRPTIFQSPDLDMIIVMTCWGASAFKDRIFEEIQKFVFAAEGDVEVTSPFEMNTYLSRDCNFLRMSTLLINDLIYRGENKEAYRSCYEIAILYKKESKLSFLQVGSPNLYLFNRSLAPLSVTVPASQSLTTNALPLPQQYLGTEMHCHFQLGEIVVDSKQKLLLFSENNLYKDIWGMKENEFNLEQVVKSQIQLDPESPFWMATIDFE